MSQSQFDSLREKIRKNGPPDAIHMHPSTLQTLWIESGYLNPIESPKLYGLKVKANPYVSKGTFLCEWEGKIQEG